MGGASVPSDNCYVTQLPDGISEDVLKAVFGQMGNITSARVLGGGKGGVCAALVRFASVEEATAVIEAIEACQGYVEGCEQPIAIRFADPPKWQQQQQKGGQGSWGKGGAGGAQWPATQAPAAGKGKGGGDSLDNLYVANLPPDTDQSEIQTIFSQYGTVASVRIVWQDEKSAAAMVKYATAEEASAVVETLNGNLPEGYERCEEGLVVRFAGSHKWQQGQQQGGGAAAAGAGFADAGGKGGGFSMKIVVKGFEAAKQLPGSMEEAVTLYVSGLPQDSENNDLYKLFGVFGALKGVNVLLQPDGSCKGIGFANFIDATGAELAIQTLNGCALQDGTQLQVKYKNPAQAGAAAAQGGGASSWIAQKIEAAAAQVGGQKPALRPLAQKILRPAAMGPENAAKKMKFI